MSEVTCPECNKPCRQHELEKRIVCGHCYNQKGAAEREALNKQAWANLNFALLKKLNPKEE